MQTLFPEFNFPDGRRRANKKERYLLRTADFGTLDFSYFDSLLYPTCISTTLDIEHLVSVEEDAEDHRELVEALTQDVLGHGGGDEGRGPAVRFPEQKMLV